MSGIDFAHDEAALAALEPDWWELWRACPAATPFASPAWLLPWWAAFRPGQLATVAIRQDGRLVGLAPLWLEDGPLGRRLLPLGIGITDHLDVLLHPDAPGAGTALVEAVRSSPDWDAWSLEELSGDAMALRLPLLDAEVADHSACPVLFLDGEHVPAAKRRKLRMSLNRVAKRDGQVAVPTDIHSFCDNLIRLHGARWRERGEAGVLDDPAVRRFHETALPGLAEAGLARLFTLTIEDQVAGAYYGLHHRGRAYAYLGGFDPAFAFESPGTVLMGHAIEVARREDAREFDLLRGQEPYKYEWGARDRMNRRLIVRRG